MDWQNSISTQSIKSPGQVIVLESEPGQARHDYLQQLLDKTQRSGAATWLLSCDQYENGLWAGLKDLLNDLVLKVQVHAPHLIIKHDYELTTVLPNLRQTLPVRYLSLTDSSPPHERVRNYGADRAFRIMHGLIDFLAASYPYFNCSTWVIACNHFDRIGALARYFFVELIRRCGQRLSLTLLVATGSGNGEIVAQQFHPQYVGQCIRLHFLPEQLLSNSEEMTKLAQELEQQIGQDSIKLELHLSQLIHNWSLSNQPEKALDYQIEAFTIYTRQGFYEDALVYGEAACAQLEHYYLKDVQKRWIIYGTLYTCYTVLGKPVQALQVVERGMAEIESPEIRFQCYYMLAMLYARLLPERDLEKAEAFLNNGLEELAKSDLPQRTILVRTAVVQNGIALIRHRQGFPETAIELCEWCYDQYKLHIDPAEHRLHRSIFLHNIARVYATTEVYNKAIDYLTAAIEMDPNYSEYYYERGNVYFNMNRFNEALNDYIKAIEVSPPYPEIWANLGLCYRFTGQFAEAINAYSVSLDLDPNQFSTFVARAELFESLNQMDTALADYDAALALNPNQPLLLANRAILHYEAGRLPEALSALDQALMLSPETPDLYQNRAIALTHLGRFDDAARDLQTYLRLSPNAEDRLKVENKLLTLQTGIVNKTCC